MDETRTWGTLARRYDSIVRAFDRSYPAIRQRLSEDLAGRWRVLEVAAGTGQFTLELARAAETLVATDLAPQMVERLRARVEDAGLDGVEVRVMSAYELELEDEGFDGLFCANALHVMEQPSRALAEFHRVLARDGVLVAPTFLHGSDLARRLLSRTLSLASPFIAHTRFDAAGLTRLVEGDGFVVERCERLPGLFPVAYLVARRC